MTQVIVTWDSFGSLVLTCIGFEEIKTIIVRSSACNPVPFHSHKQQFNLIICTSKKTITFQMERNMYG